MLEKLARHACMASPAKHVDCCSGKSVTRLKISVVFRKTYVVAMYELMHEVE